MCVNIHTYLSNNCGIINERLILIVTNSRGESERSFFLIFFPINFPRKFIHLHPTSSLIFSVTTFL